MEVGIIGAGIHGAALARELTLRGVSCALVDRGARGRRHLPVVHQAVPRRHPLPGHRGHPPDARGAAGAGHLGAHRARPLPLGCLLDAPRGACWKGSPTVSASACTTTGAPSVPGWPQELRLGGVPRERFEADPRAPGGPFRGAVAYADLLTWDREVVRDLAASSAARVLDFHDVEGWSDPPGSCSAARVRDRRDGAARTVAAGQWVFALGPWTDRALEGWFQEGSRRLRLSAGIHLWLDPVPGCERPWAMRRPGGRILFVIPRDGLLQVGTTEREVDDGWVPIVARGAGGALPGPGSLLPAIPWRTLPVHREELGVRPLLAGQGSTVRLAPGGGAGAPSPVRQPAPGAGRQAHHRPPAHGPAGHRAHRARLPRLPHGTAGGDPGQLSRTKRIYCLLVSGRP